MDGLLSARQEGSGEHESSRRLKTEFLAQMDGLEATAGEQLLVLAATNRYHLPLHLSAHPPSCLRPGELDEAARRRFAQRIYVGLPDSAARADILTRALNTVEHCLHEPDFAQFAEASQGKLRKLIGLQRWTKSRPRWTGNIGMLKHAGAGYSGSDLKEVCRVAAMAPLRRLLSEASSQVPLATVGPSFVTPVP